LGGFPIAPQTPFGSDLKVVYEKGSWGFPIALALLRLRLSMKAVYGKPGDYPIVAPFSCDLKVVYEVYL
jgi:hypothetical protein